MAVNLVPVIPSEIGATCPSVYTNVMVNKVITFPADKDNITSVQYSTDGNFLVCGDADGRLLILSGDTGAILRPVKHYKHGSVAIMCIRFHPMKHNEFLVGTANGIIRRCEATTGASQSVATEVDNVIHCMDICKAGERVITVGKDLKVRIYDEVSMQLIRTIHGFAGSAAPDEALVGHGLRVFGLKCHPEYDHVFVTGGWDNHLKIWDSRTDAGVVSIIHGPHICGDSIDINGSYIVAGSWVKTNSLQLFDFNMLKLVKDLTFQQSGDGEYLYCTKFANEVTVLSGGSGTNSAQAININTNELVAEVKLGHAVLAMHTALEGRRFCVAGSCKHMKLCSLLE